MPTTINASNTSGGAIITPDGSGVLELQSGGVTGLTVSGANVTVAGTLAATGGINISGGITGTLPVANGGTGATTLTGVVKGNGTGAFTAGTVSVSEGGTGAVTLTGVVKGTGTSALTAGTVSLTTEVSGTLPVANGGTGAVTLTGVVKGTGTSALTAGTVSLTTEISGTLPVANGGTGAVTLTANAVLIGNGTSAVAAVAPGTTGNLLTSNGTTWTSAAPSSGMTLLASYTPSNTSSLIIDTFFTSTYNKYLIYVTDFVPPSSAFVNVRFYIGGVLQTGAVYSNYTQYFVGGYNGVTSSSGQSNGLITPGTATTWNNVPMCIEISEPTSSRVKGIFFNGAGIVAGGNTYTFNGGIGINNTGTFTGLQFTPSSGTFSGKFYLFGLQK